MKNNTLLALAIIIAMLACASCAGRSASAECADCAVSEPFDSLFSAMFPRDEPGGIVGISVDGEPVYLHGFGKARLDTDKPYTDSTATNICSATKIFVATAVMKLVEQHRLSLNQSIAEFFPNFTSPVFKEITLRHIL